MLFKYSNYTYIVPFYYNMFGFNYLLKKFKYLVKFLHTIIYLILNTNLWLIRIFLRLLLKDIVFFNVSEKYYDFRKQSIQGFKSE